MTLSTNPELELAFDYVQHTNKNIFLTGKAGTGKTTFLHRVKHESIKRTVIVAPTGVAAINAKGMTIHSFFQLPFGPHIPGGKPDPTRQRKFTRKKINLIKSVDLLIIDEISMVRSDMLDAIDEVMRRYKNRNLPFGGAQLLMIGDLHQLPPVVKEHEWQMLSQYYNTPYFFGSHALQKSQPVTVQLKHIYRQSDDVFINLLNKVRDNQLDTEVLETLNSRYIENFEPSEEDGYITLTSHNAAANSINQKKLDALTTVSHKFTAKVDGDFPKHAYPTEEVLSFKKGAQVLFIKNDSSPDKLYYNGKIGKITSIDDGTIYVKCKGDSDTIAVGMVDWNNVKYNLNERTKEVSEDEVGKFTQYPLKLAWAITIHKSQGLTFERAIIDAAAAFAHGQVYVALSRCKSFEGIVLHSKINYSSVKTDTVVKDYSKKAELNAPNANDLEQSRREFQQSLVEDLFNFQPVRYAMSDVSRTFLAHENTMTTAAVLQLNEYLAKLEAEVVTFAIQFKPQLQAYFQNENLPEDNTDLQARLKKASAYFSKKITKESIPEIKAIPILADSQAVKKTATDNVKNLERLLFIKNECFKVVEEAFVTQRYLKTRTNADMDFEKASRTSSANISFNNIPRDVKHPKLYAQIRAWREEEAKEMGKNPYEIISTTAIGELAEFLPTSTEALLQIKGIGQIKVRQYGSDIVDMIETYCTAKGIQKNLLITGAAKRKPKVSETKKKSFDLFKAGRTIEEIASMRGLVSGTIHSHLLHYVGTGEADIFKIMQRDDVAAIEDFLTKNIDVSSSVAKTFFGDRFGYDELRMVKAFLKKKEEETV